MTVQNINQDIKQKMEPKLRFQTAELQRWKQFSRTNATRPPFCPEISSDRNNQGRRRKPNPLRISGRVFNFQVHQYVPRNPLPRCSNLSDSAHSSLPLSSSLSLSASPPVVATRPTGFLLPHPRPKPSLLRLWSIDGAPRATGCCIHLSFRWTLGDCGRTNEGWKFWWLCGCDGKFFKKTALRYANWTTRVQLYVDFFLKNVDAYCVDSRGTLSR